MAYDKRQATEEFTIWSRSYDRGVLQPLLFAPSRRALGARLAQRFGSKPFRLLDVGCGTGQFVAEVRDRFPHAEVVALDLVRGMLERGRERWERIGDRVRPVQGDGERLPFVDQTFDVITCANSFHHYPHQDQAIREMQRVLKPGGRLILLDGYRDAPWGWFIYDVCVTAVEGAVLHCSRKRMRHLYHQAGLEMVEQRIHRGPAPFLVSEGRRPVSAIPAPHTANAARATAESQARNRI